MDRRQILKGLGIGAAGAAAGGFSKQLPGPEYKQTNLPPAIGAGGPDPKLSPVEEYDPVTRMVKLHEQGWVSAEEAFSILTGIPKPEPPPAPPPQPIGWPHYQTSGYFNTWPVGLSATVASFPILTSSASAYPVHGVTWASTSTGASLTNGSTTTYYNMAGAVEAVEPAAPPKVLPVPELPAPKVKGSVKKRVNR